MLNKVIPHEQKSKVGATDNLRKLADVYFAKQELTILDEIQNARDVINNVCANVKRKISNASFQVPKEPLKKETPLKNETALKKESATNIKTEPVRHPAVLPSKGIETRDPGHLDASHFNSGNNFNVAFGRRSSFQDNNSQRKPYGQNAQQGGYQRNNNFSNRRPFDSKNASSNRPQFGQRNSFGNRPSFGNNQKPFGQRPFGSRPFGKPGFNRLSPLNRLGTAEVNIDINSLKSNERFNKKKSHNEQQERKQISKKAQMRWNVEDYDDDNEEQLGRRYKNKKKEIARPQIIPQKVEYATITTDNLTVKILSEKIGVSVAEIVKKLFILGIMATVNSNIDFDTAELVSNEFGVKLAKKVAETAEQQLQNSLDSVVDDDPSKLVKRPPIVTVMGHVDHGKTSLLDAIRKTNVASGEAGGITQSIGAYVTKVKDRTITFIDTPGHSAFAAMRARGAQITDIAVLVVAADDGIMPQTVEAINNIKEAKVPMIVAINKIDKPEANIDKVMKGLADHDILPEEWGGDTICVPISAKRGTNIEKLLEMILLVADVQDLKANPDRNAIGTVIESRLDKGKGPVASILVENGTLKVGDTVVTGIAFGRIRAMMDENGKPVKTAGPSTPVQILGLDAVPESGDKLTVVDEKMKSQIIEERKNKIKLSKIKQQTAVSLDDFFNKVNEGNLKNLNIVIKADVQGSVEALKSSLVVLKNEEAKVVCVHSGVGNITESDVLLAQASNAKIIAFNVKADEKAKEMAKHDKVEIKSYNVIYECIDDVEKALKHMMAPKFADKSIGTVEVRQIFKISSVGTIAGCYVLDGKVVRNAKVRVLRNNKQVGEALIDSLKIQKNEAKEVGKGMECGIKLKNFDDVRELDQFEIIVSEQVAL